MSSYQDLANGLRLKQLLLELERFDFHGLSSPEAQKIRQEIRFLMTELRKSRDS